MALALRTAGRFVAAGGAAGRGGGGGVAAVVVAPSLPTTVPRAPAPRAPAPSRASTTSASGLSGLSPYLSGEAGARFQRPYLAWVDTVRASALLAAKVHLGHTAARTTRAVTGQLYGFRHNVAVFDVNKTWRSMRSLFYAFAEMAQHRSTFFVLAPNPGLAGLPELCAAMKAAYPFRYDRFNSLYMNGYADSKWVRGTFSNWRVTTAFAASVRASLLAQPSSRRFKRLARVLKGLDDLDLFSRVFPDFVLVLAGDREALAEVRGADLPLVGIVDSDEDPAPFLYPVFANNDSLESVQFVLDLVARGVEEGRRREQEAFALLLVRKIKQYLAPDLGTSAALMVPVEEDADAWLPPRPAEAFDEQRPEWLARVGGEGYIKLPGV